MREACLVAGAGLGRARSRGDLGHAWHVMLLLMAALKG
jgi:hypothetical protein